MSFTNRATLFSIVFCLAAQVHHALCLGVKFTLPAPGATWPAGDVTVNWTDAGGIPDMSDLTTYSLVLMVGGNSPTNSKAVATIGGGAPGAMIKDGGVEANIPADVGQSIQNGYYLCLTSNTTTGNQVINYSDRFTLIEMNGTTDQIYVSGASSSVGNDNVPTPQYNVISQSTSTATSSQIASTTTTSGAVATATATSTSTSAANEQYSISGGALAGLAVGTICAVVLFLILAVMMLLWLRKRRRARKTRKRSEEDKLPDTALQNWGDKVELSARPTSTLPRSRTSPAELSPEQERFEVGESMPAAELAATRQSVYELESDWSGWEAAARKSRQGAYDPTL